MEYFKPFREERERLKKNMDHVKDILNKGAEKARETAAATKAEVWEKVGLNI
jgi:hypothetical protein